MKDSAAIKRANKALIYRLLTDSPPCTKQQIARRTGLSVASCNTYLNEMEHAGQVLGQKQKLHDVGRDAVVYRLNEDYECFLCLSFALIQGVKSITTDLLSPTGRLLEHTVEPLDRLDAAAILDRAEAALGRHPNISQILAGTPSIAEHGVIRHSDIPELEEVPLKALLEEGFHRPVHLANDMHYKVYGYYRQQRLTDQIVTLVNYPAGVLPGTATIHKGVLLTGKNFFAGMVGFLDYGMTLDQQLQRLRRPGAEPLIIQAAIALISILNPHRLLFTGDLLRAEDLGPIADACRRCIPAEYMPELVFLPSTDDCYRWGMYWTAIDRKEQTP